jgi:hypothetical protein
MELVKGGYEIIVTLHRRADAIKDDSDQQRHKRWGGDLFAGGRVIHDECVKTKSEQQEHQSELFDGPKERSSDNTDGQALRCLKKSHRISPLKHVRCTGGSMNYLVDKPSRSNVLSIYDSCNAGAPSRSS